MTKAETFLKNKGLHFASLGRSRVDNTSVTDLMEQYHQSQLKPQVVKVKRKSSKVPITHPNI